MEYQELLDVAVKFATAILLGALVGIEREKRKGEHGEASDTAGLRTFTLLALFGAATGWLAQETDSFWIPAAGLLIVGVFVAAGYVVSARSDPDSTGLTTEIAAVVVFLLGAMVTLDYMALAGDSAWSLPRCSPTRPPCMASSPSSAGMTFMPACGC